MRDVPHITLTRAPIVTPLGNEVIGLKAHVLVYVWLRSSAERKAWRGALHHFGVQTIGRGIGNDDAKLPVDCQEAIAAIGDGLFVFDLAGYPDALMGIVSTCELVKQYEFPTNATISNRGAGNTKTK